MRVTNSMILNTSKGNINSTKVSVNSTTDQMTTQKKISRPSEDPVVAVRALRFSTTLSKLNQYSDNNIPDAEKWLDVTETALSNMSDLVKDFRTQCVNGSTGTLTTDDRNTILSQLQQLQASIYQEGDSDYAGRTVFTGYRTDQTLTFQSDSSQTYEISQTLDYSDLETGRYYSGSVTVPTNEADILDTSAISDITKTEYSKLRLPYDDVSTMNSLTISFGGNDYEFDLSTATAIDIDADGDGTPESSYTQTVETIDGISTSVYVFDSEADWESALGSKTIGDNDIVVVKGTGEIIFGSGIDDTVSVNKAKVSVDYDKTGFDKGELKPEFYYNCIDKTTVDPITYTKYDSEGNLITQEINYNIAQNQSLAVNIEASDVFDSSIIQDINDMISAVNKAQDAADKVTSIKTKMSDAQYASDDDQAALQEWLDAAQKEKDYYDDNLQKLFSSNLTKADGYLNKISLATTKVGCKEDQLDITQTRVSNQIETVEELQSDNEDLDLSEIMIDYTAAYTAYEASLTAASKLGEISLLNYI